MLGFGLDGLGLSWRRLSNLRLNGRRLFALATFAFFRRGFYLLDRLLLRFRYDALQLVATAVVDVQDFHFDRVARLDDVGDAADVLVGQRGDVHQSGDVGSNFHERAIVSRVGDRTVDDVADMNLHLGRRSLSGGAFALFATSTPWGPRLGITIAIDLLEIGTSHLVDTDDLDGDLIAGADNVTNVVHVSGRQV